VGIQHFTGGIIRQGDQDILFVHEIQVGDPQRVHPVPPAVAGQSLGEAGYELFDLVILWAFLQNLDATVGVRHETGPSSEGMDCQ